MNKKQFGKWILQLLELFPDKWSFSEYRATFELDDYTLNIWIANRPYADLTVNGCKFGTWWQRRQIRKKIDSLSCFEVVAAVESRLLGETVEKLGER